MILSIPAIILEGSGVINWLYTYDSTVPALIIIITSGVLAFCLNFSIFYVIHSTTAVTFNVAGNLKVRGRPPSTLFFSFSNIENYAKKFQN
jgi:hypothetical protein